MDKDKELIVNAEALLGQFDKICLLLGKQPISSIIKSFSDKIPEELRETVISNIKDDVTNAIKTGLTESVQGFEKVLSNPNDFLTKVTAELSSKEAETIKSIGD